MTRCLLTPTLVATAVLLGCSHPKAEPSPNPGTGKADEVVHTANLNFELPEK